MFLNGGVGVHEIGSAALDNIGAIGKGTGAPLLFGVMVQGGELRPILPFATAVDPAKGAGASGGDRIRFTFDSKRFLAGGLLEPRAQQGRCRIHAMHVQLKHTLQSSVMRDSLHL